MILVKCSCGCHFTLQNKTLNSELATHPFICPNCHASLNLHPLENSIEMARAVSSSGFEVHVLPDNAKFDVSYKL